MSNSSDDNERSVRQFRTSRHGTGKEAARVGESLYSLINLAHNHAGHPWLQLARGVLDQKKCGNHLKDFVSSLQNKLDKALRLREVLLVAGLTAGFLGLTKWLHYYA